MKPQEIKSYNYWSLILHENQCYLGRAYLWAKRSDAIDFIEMTADEREEFFAIAKRYKKVLNDLFMPDLHNYASLGNITNHLHIHIIPRYIGTRNFEGLEFADNRWGMNYVPEDESFDMDTAKFNDLKNILYNNLAAIDKVDAL